MRDWQYWVLATVIALAIFVVFTIATNPNM